MPDPIAKKLISILQLKPHPEGGYFKQTYLSDENIRVPTRYIGKVRPISSQIYYLLSGDDFSAWHRIKTDEVWHFYSGSTITLHVITAEETLQHIKLGNPLIDPNASFQCCVERDQWFAASVDDTDSYALVGCSVAPAFDYRDWQLASATNLLKQYPQHSYFIKKYSREECMEDRRENSASVQPPI